MAETPEVNAVKGEFLIELGELKLVIVPLYGRIAKAEALLGRSLVKVAGEMVAGHGLMAQEMAALLHVLAKDPKPSRENIGKRIVAEGYVKAIPAIQEIVDHVVFGEHGDPDDEESSDGDPEGNEEEGESNSE